VVVVVVELVILVVDEFVDDFVGRPIYVRIFAIVASIVTEAFNIP